SLATADDIKNIHQELNLWTGQLVSSFRVEDMLVKVFTVCHPELDAVSFKIQSPLVVQGRIQIRIRFPYPNGQWKDVGNSWLNDDKHSSSIDSQSASQATIKRKLDTSV